MLVLGLQRVFSPAYVRYFTAGAALCLFVVYVTEPIRYIHHRVDWLYTSLDDSMRISVWRFVAYITVVIRCVNHCDDLLRASLAE